MRDELELVTRPRAPVVTYEEIAAEYYDPRRHPTCANFREASAWVLGGWLRRFPVAAGRSCEVGAGDSLLAELLADAGAGLEGLVISDASPSMLRYSARWAGRGARLVLGPAESLPFPDAGFDLLVSSLGDPYNVPAFWAEVFRVLRPGGLAFFTTPSCQWATAFRSGDGDEIMSAEFETSGGQTVRVPSWIYPAEEQVRLIEDHRLAVLETVHVRRSALKGTRISQKLLPEEAPSLSVVTGYLAAKGEARQG